MFLGNKRMQRLVVGLIVAALAISLALSLVSSALAAPVASAPGVAHEAAQTLRTNGATPTPEPGLLDSSGEPKPVTKTPQGTSTQVTDKEHIGGLIAFIAFMSGGVLLLLRSRRRERRAEAQESILSAP